MRHVLIIGLIALAPHAAAQAPSTAQTPPPTQTPPTTQTPATTQQTDILTAIARCMAAGLPPDWYEAQVVVTLDEPGGVKGDGRYTFSRQIARTDFEPFTPCGYLNPAKMLVEMRGTQLSDQRQWKSARFVLYRDGKFDLTYDYPKKVP